MYLVWVDSGQLKYMLWKCWDIHMHRLCPQRGEWNCPDILKSPSGKKRKENYQFVIKGQESFSMYRWWLHPRMSWSAGYLPLENGAAVRAQASGWRSCGWSLNPQGFWPYKRLSPGSGRLSGEGGSPASPNSHQMVFVIQRQHFFDLYNDFWHAVHSVRWRHGFVSVQCCFSCSSQPSLVTPIGGSMTQSQRYLWDDQGGLPILSYTFSLAFQWMEAGLPGLSGQCVTADAGEAFRSVQGPAPILPHSMVVPSARARAFRK